MVRKFELVAPEGVDLGDTPNGGYDLAGLREVIKGQLDAERHSEVEASNEDHLVEILEGELDFEVTEVEGEADADAAADASEDTEGSDDEDEGEESDETV